MPPPSPPPFSIPQVASDCEVAEDASDREGKRERERDGPQSPTAVSWLKLSHEQEIWRTSFPCS